MVVPCVSGIREDLPLNFAEQYLDYLITPSKQISGTSNIRVFWNLKKVFQKEWLRGKKQL